MEHGTIFKANRPFRLREITRESYNTLKCSMPRVVSNWLKFFPSLTELSDILLVIPGNSNLRWQWTREHCGLNHGRARLPAASCKAGRHS
jgi:hypothetical protein